MAEPIYLPTSSASEAGKPSHGSARHAGRSVGIEPTITSTPEINSVGPPPYIHADRIIGLML
jgi:hypothetical protein